MSRPLRIEYEGAFYHITARGNEKRTIFVTEKDFARFLGLFERVHERYGTLIPVYVLMTNHYHLLIETPHSNLIATLHDLNTAYTNYFNRRHDRVGHLFQGRYRSIVVEKDAYLLELSRYIHLNPVRARMVERPEAYPWSSYGSYLSSKTSPGWFCREQILGQMDRDFGKARRKYRQFVEEGLRKEIKNPLEGVIAGMVLGGEGFCKEIKGRVQKLEAGREIPTLREVQRKVDVGAIVQEVSSFYGVSPEVIRQKRRPPHEGSQVAIYLTRKKTGLSLNEIAAYFGGRHYTAVSTAFRRVEQRRHRNGMFDHELGKIEKKIQRKGDGSI